MEQFMKLFRFDPAKSFFVGIERECFLRNTKGDIIPIAPRFLSALPQSDAFGYELSACQLEERIGPCLLHEISDRFVANDRIISVVEKKLNVHRSYKTVAPSSLPLDVYPDPSGRYALISRSMDRSVLSAACRIIGVHIHIGMPDHATALFVHNKVVSYIDFLCRQGDISDGKRMRLYKRVVSDYMPVPFKDWKHFYRFAVRNKFHRDPRSCWKIMRISPHGTIEFRMFDSTASIDTIVEWAHLCHSLCITVANEMS